MIDTASLVTCHLKRRTDIGNGIRVYISGCCQTNPGASRMTTVGKVMQENKLLIQS